MPRLTDKQKTFAQEYVRSGFDRLQAIKEAGYSERSWESIACRLLQKEQIKREIDRLLGEAEEKCTIEASEIIQELRKIAFAPVSERVNNSDRLKALELLGRTKAMWSDKVIHQDSEKEVKRRARTKEENELIQRYVKWRMRVVAMGADAQAQMAKLEGAVDLIEMPETIKFEQPKAG